MARGDKRSQSDARDVALDIVPNRRGFILKVGPVFLSLDRPTAEELLCLLAEALEVSDPLGITTGSN